MSRFHSAEDVRQYWDWRDEQVAAAGEEIPRYGSPEWAAAGRQAQLASYLLEEEGRTISDRNAAEHSDRVARRDASHDIAAYGGWHEHAQRVAAGRGDYVERKPVEAAARGDPAAAVERAIEAVAEVVEQDRQHEAAQHTAAQDADDHQGAEHAWT